MAVREVAPPSHTTVVHADDIAALERWAEQQRAELVALAAELQVALLEADRAERAMTHPEKDDDPPAAFFAVVDAALATAADQFATELEVVRAEAAAVVAAAASHVSAQLAVVGGHVDAISGMRAETPVRLRRPRRAADLWQTLDRSTAASSSDHTVACERLVSVDLEALLASEPAFWRDLPDRRLLDRMRTNHWSTR